MADIDMKPVATAIDGVIAETEKNPSAASDPELKAALDRLRKIREDIKTACTSSSETMSAAAVTKL